MIGLHVFAVENSNKTYAIISEMYLAREGGNSNTKTVLLF